MTRTDPVYIQYIIAEYAKIRAKRQSRCDGGPGSGNWGHAGVKGQRGGSAPGGGAANRLGSKEKGFSSAVKVSSAWSKKCDEEMASVLSKKRNMQALYISDTGFATDEVCIKAMRSGDEATKKLVEDYFDVLKKNGDTTPTNPTSKQLSSQLDQDVRDGKYDGDWEKARKGYMKEMAGMDDAQTEKTYKEMRTWFGGSWDRADTETLDNYVASDHVYDGTMYRGMHFERADYDDFMKDVKPGSTINMRSKNSSWSSDEETAARFAHRNDETWNSITIECVKNRTSAPVAHLAGNGEGEVLASSKAQWTVLHAETYDTAYGTKKTRITVMEKGE